MSIYETKVTNIGSDATMFSAEEMIILFGENTPEDLIDYVYNIVVNLVDGDILVGQTLWIDDQSYKITAVGNVVKKNLENFGHITLRFDGSIEAELPGTLYLEQKPMPEINVNSILKITA